MGVGDCATRSSRRFEAAISNGYAGKILTLRTNLRVEIDLQLELDARRENARLEDRGGRAANR
jgi:hypothetical protein